VRLRSSSLRQQYVSSSSSSSPRFLSVIATMSVEVFIYSQPKHSGKSEKLMAWSDLQAPASVAGFLSPTHLTEDKRKVLYDLQTKNTFPFEEREPSSATVRVNSYNLVTAAFSHAEEIYDRTEGAAIFVVDEVGPLELQDGGHHNLLVRILGEKKTPSLLLVVREGLVDDVVAKYLQGLAPHVLESLEGFTV